MWVEVQLLESFRREYLLSSLLHCSSVEFWDLRIVFKQRRSLDAWLLLVPSVVCTVQTLLWRKRFMCTPLKCSLSFFITGFLGRKRGYHTPPFCWWRVTGHLVLSLGSLCLPLHLGLRESEARPGRPVGERTVGGSHGSAEEPRSQMGARAARGK